MYILNTNMCVDVCIHIAIGLFLLFVPPCSFFPLSLFLFIVAVFVFSFSYICMSAYIFDWIRDRKSHRPNRHEVLRVKQNVHQSTSEKKRN